MYKLFYDNNVDLTVMGGDLTDTTTIRSEELTAITDAFNFRNTSTPEIGVLGNHERISTDGSVNSINYLNLLPNYKLYTSPGFCPLGDTLICILPYNEYSKDDIDKFIEESKIQKSNSSCDHMILLSHNDIYGADLGGFTSNGGLDPKLLANTYDMTLNGHIHNGSWVIKDKVLNAGSLSGQNFSSKFLHWQPSVIIYDSEDNSVKFYENPYALRFKTINANTMSEFTKQIGSIPDDRIYGISVKAPSELSEDIRLQLDNMNNVANFRIRETYDNGSTEEQRKLEEFDNLQNFSENSYQVLYNYVKDKADTSGVDKENVLDTMSK